jgi:Carboxypeptidase regulatory-like domain/TonB-dependent Receptor Plug Domain/TonB dependent receptor
MEIMMKKNNLSISGVTEKIFAAMLAVLLTAIFLTAPINAQQESGQINGTVKDPNEAVIPGATVTVRNTATNGTRTVTTDSDGNYLITNLQPGSYEVTAVKQGFQDAKESVQVTVGGRITVSLTAGVQNQSVTVDVTTGGGAEINTTDQQLSTTITGKQIQDLPILNRNPYSLVNLSGNVSTAASDGGRGAGVAINGQRAASTSILLDGAENSDIFTAGIAQTTPLESVAEFQVITSNFSAEYGRASGGIVNVSTRAGSNRFQGSLFAYNRNSALAANTFDNNAKGAERPFFNRNQFGYAVAGPILKDKLFFSNSTEWTRVRSSATLFAYVPTQQLINLNANTRNFFSSYGALGGNTTVGGVVSCVEVFPATSPTNPNYCVNTFGSGGNNFPLYRQVSYQAPVDAGGGTPQNTYSTVTRVDWNVSDKTQIYGRYAQERPQFLQGSQANSPYAGFDIGTVTLNNNMLVNFTRSFGSNFVSNTKAAYRRINTKNTLANDPATPTLYFFANQTASFNGDNIALPGYLPFNPGSGLPVSGTQQLFQINQDTSYLVGKHTFKFGGQYVYISDNTNFQAFQNATLTLGSTTAGAVANLANGQLLQLQVAIDPQGKFPGQSVTLPVKYPEFSRDNRYNEYALYFNDTWRILPRLNINLGLRYEYYGVQKSKAGLDANFYFGSGSTIQEQVRNGFAGIASENGGLWRPDKNNFAPRVGFAYDLTGDGKTSIRGGYGIAYERNFGNVTFNVIQNPPFYAVLSAFSSDFGGNLPIPTNSFGPLAGSGGTRVLPRTSLRYVRNDIKNAYAHLWSLAFEREVFKDSAFRAEYSGSAGRDLYSIENLNRLGTSTRYLGTNNAAVCPAGFAPNSRLNCQYTNINTRGNSGYSNYNSLSLSLVGNDLLKSGLAFTARYTYSVSKDNLSSTFSESANNFNLGLTDPFDPKYDYGNADFDLRHRFVASFNYDVPFARNLSNGFAKSLLDGFSINGILTANTGAPFTIFDCTNAITTCLRIKPTAALARSNSNPTAAGANIFTYLDLSNQTPNPFTDVSGGTEVGPFPTDVTKRNAFRAPGGWNMDLGFIKNFRVSERYGIQLRAELINAFNTTDFQIVGGSADLTNGAVQVVKTGSGPRNAAGNGTARTIQLSAKFKF